MLCALVVPLEPEVNPVTSGLRPGNVNTPSILATLTLIARQLIQCNSRDSFELQKESSYFLIPNLSPDLKGPGDGNRELYSLDLLHGV